MKIFKDDNYTTEIESQLKSLEQTQRAIINILDDYSNEKIIADK